jgi:RNA polymerase sigma-B factor
VVKMTNTERAAKTEEYLKRFQDGDEYARDLVIELNMGLVHGIVNREHRGSRLKEDLEQVGMIGLMKAVDRFDFSFSVRFSSYAGTMVRGEIAKYFRDKEQAVHIPRTIKETIGFIKTHDLLDFTAEEIATLVQERRTNSPIKLHHVEEALYFITHHNISSLDFVLDADDEGGAFTLADSINGDLNEGELSVETRLDLQRAMHVLDEREKVIVDEVFFNHKSQKETGKMLGLSQMQVSRMQARALAKMKDYFTNPDSKLVISIKVPKSKKKQGRPQHEKVEVETDLEWAQRLFETTQLPQAEIRRLTGISQPTAVRYEKKFRPAEVREAMRAEKRRIKEEAIHLLKTTSLSSDDIAVRTGAVTATVKKYADKYRPEETKQEVKSRSMENLKLGGASRKGKVYPKPAPIKIEEEVIMADKIKQIDMNFVMELSGSEVSKEEVVGKLKNLITILEQVDADTISFNAAVEKRGA